MNEIRRAPNHNFGSPDPNIASLIHLGSYVAVKMYMGVTIFTRSWKKEPILQIKRKFLPSNTTYSSKD